MTHREVDIFSIAELGKILRLVRKESGLTQRDAAALCYVDESAKLDNLRAENARLIALLEAHGIAWKKPANPVQVQPPKESELSTLSADEKVALFMRLFRGRTDVYLVRWESKKTGKSGYSPFPAAGRKLWTDHRR